MEIVKRIVDTKTKEVAYYEVLDKGEKAVLLRTTLQYRNNEEITNAVFDGKTGLCKAKAGYRIPTVTVADYFKDRHLRGMERLVYKEFEAWQQRCVRGSKVALYVEGARQVGKTFAIQQYCYRHFNNVVYLNLIDEPEFIQTMQTSCATHFSTQFYAYLNRTDRYLPDCKDSVLIIDEVQEAIVPIYNKIRLFLSTFKFQLVVTGSYMGALYAKDKKVFFSAGSILPITMFPLSFEEVCRAADKISEKQVYELYRKYGGYPAVVKKYLEKGKGISEEDIKQAFEAIWVTFCTESEKYLDVSLRNILPVVINNIVIELLHEKKGSLIRDNKGLLEKVRTRFKNVNITSELVESAIHWLCTCGVIIRVGMHTDGNVEFMPTLMRYYMNDCGLLRYFALNTVREDSSVVGLITENYAFMELYRKRLNALSTATFNNYELDFVFISSDHKSRVGVEVKTSDGSVTSAKMFKKHGLIDKYYKICSEQGKNNILLWEIYKHNF